MWKFFRSIADDGDFQSFILWLILINAFLLGLETHAPLIDSYGEWFGIAYLVIQVIFVVEIAIRLLAYGPTILPFFRDGWNCFDFVIVALSLIPASGPFATVARVFRLLRLTRLVSVSDNLRATVSGITKSLASICYVLIVFSLVLYIYSILGFYLFGESSAGHWASLGSSFLTLLRIVTLDGWSELQSETMAEFPFAWVYFLSFLLCSLVLAVGLIISAARSAWEGGSKGTFCSNNAATGEELPGTLEALHRELAAIKSELGKLTVGGGKNVL